MGDGPRFQDAAPARRASHEAGVHWAHLAPNRDRSLNYSVKQGKHRYDCPSRRANQKHRIPECSGRIRHQAGEWCSRLLSLAGWDTFDVSQVVPEYTVGNRRVDYALRPGSPNAVFIEVKRPGENLERHQQQLLEYCFQEGVKLAVLTNGRTWWLYLPLQAGSWEQRRFLTIDLEVQEPSVVERWFLEYLSRERVGSGQAVGDAEDLVESQQQAEIIGKTIAAAWTQIIGTPDELLVDLI